MVPVPGVAAVRVAGQGSVAVPVPAAALVAAAVREQAISGLTAVQLYSKLIQKRRKIHSVRSLWSSVQTEMAK